MLGELQCDVYSEFFGLFVCLFQLLLRSLLLGEILCYRNPLLLLLCYCLVVHYLPDRTSIFEISTAELSLPHLLYL